jgi:very-short-patch-repair endonuclease
VRGKQKVVSIPPNILKNARELRSTQTDAEKCLLRNRLFCGYKFRRQHPFGGFILDFYCHDASLAIELDGSSHSVGEQKAYDDVRTKELEGAGIRVLRFWNDDVLKDIESVLETIYTELSPSPGLWPPSPSGRGV